MKLKKLLIFLFTFISITIVTVFFVTFSANAEDEISVYGSFLYVKDTYDPVASLVGYRGDYENVVIPDYIDGYAIIDIAEKAFENKKNLVSVVLGDNVEYLYADAFYNCPNLTYLTIGKNTSEINGGFYNCSKLISVTIPSDNTYLKYNNGLIYSYDGKTIHFCPPGKSGSVSIASTVTNMGYYSFYNCSNITSVTIPNGVTALDQTVFISCDNLESITLPSSLNEITEPFIVNSTSLKTITLPKNVINIENGVFAYALGLENINVSNLNVKYTSTDGILLNRLGNTILAFPSGRFGEYSIPSNIRTISDYAFANAKISKIIIGANVNQIETYGLYGMGNLSEISVNSSNRMYSAEDGILYSKNKTTLLLCPSDTRDIITLPNSVTEINSYAFSNCIKLEEVVLPRNLEMIQNFAFSGCESLKKIEIPKDTLIGSNAFEYCENLEEVKINNRVSIGDFAFSFSGIRYINLPGDCQLGNSVFYGCEDLLTVDLCVGFETIPKETFYLCTSLTSITIPEGVKHIGIDAFYNCSDLSYVYIPSSMEEICDQAFFQTKFLKKIYYGGDDFENIKYYDEDNSIYAFNGDVTSNNKSKPCTTHNYNYKLCCRVCNRYTFEPTLVKENQYIYYYYDKGVMTNFNGIFKYNGLYYNIKYGVWYQNNDIAEYEGKTVAVVDGFVDFTYSGMLSITDSSEVYVKKGIVYDNLDKPTLKLTAVAGGVKLSWNKIHCATWYNIYKSTYSGGTWSSYKYLTRTKNSTSYTDNNLGSSTKVRYRIYAYNLTHESKYSASQNTIYLARPTVKIKNTTTGINISWNKVKGAQKYIIYKSIYSGGKWSNYKSYKTTTSLSFTDKSVSSGKKVRYTVYAYKDGFKSAFKTGKSILYLSSKKPNTTKITGGIKVGWTKVAGAKGYMVYRREYKNGKWTSLKTIKKTTSLKYNDKTAKKGVKYQYVVRAYNGAYKSAINYSAIIKR